MNFWTIINKCIKNINGLNSEWRVAVAERTEWAIEALTGHQPKCRRYADSDTQPHPTTNRVASASLASDSSRR